MRELVWWPMRGVIGCLLLLSAAATQAETISDTVELRTLAPQDMWSSGGATGATFEQFIGTRWGTYGSSGVAATSTFGGTTGGVHNNVCIGYESDWVGCVGFRANIDTTTGVEVSLTSSGQVGLYAGIELTAGGIEAVVPVAATIQMPDYIRAGEAFVVQTTGELQSDGALLKAHAPSFRAFVDGVFDTENNLAGKAFVLGVGGEGDVDFDVNLGRFNIMEFDSAREDRFSVLGTQFEGPRLRMVQRVPFPPWDPDGNNLTPRVTGPLSVPNTKPILLEAEVKLPLDQSATGLNGNRLSLIADHDLVDVDISLTGFLEAFATGGGAPAILKNSFTLVDSPKEVKVEYTIANIEAGPVLGMRQQFDITPVPAVRLKFDVPVKRKVLVGYTPVVIGYRDVWDWGTFSYNQEPIYRYDPVYAYVDVPFVDGVSTVEVTLGEDVELIFAEDGGRLLERTYFMSDATRFHNETAFTLSAEARMELLGLKIPLLGEGFLFDESIRTDALSVPLKTIDTAMGGFNEVGIAQVFQLTAPPAPVPEPGTLVLVLFGALAAAVHARRKRS